MFRWASDRLGVWAFVVSVAFIPGIMSSAILGRWAAVAIGVPLVAPLRWTFPPWLNTVLVAGLAWAGASILVAPDRLDSLLQFFFMISLVGVMGAASQQSSLDEPMEGLCWGVAVSLLFCFLGLDGEPVVAQGTPGYAGLFYNSEVLCEFAAPLAVWAMAKRHWHMVGITLLPILMNNSRISYVIVIVGAVMAFWPKSWKWRVAVTVVGAVVTCAVVYAMTLTGSRFGSGVYRIAIWLVAGMSITPAGHGIGAYRVMHPAEEFVHSDVIQAFVELGLGALFFVPIVIRALRNTEARAEHAAFIVLCIELVVSFPLHVPGAAFLVALLAGWLARDRTRVCGVRPHGGIDAVEDDEWSSPVWGDVASRGGFRCFGISLRRPVEALPVMDLSRDCAQGAG